MKKIIFSFFFLLIFGLIISNKNNLSTHHKYTNNNTFIEYPSFINNDLNNYIKTINYDYLFVDYDYIDENNLTMYIYSEYNNIAKEITKNYVTNNKNNTTYDFINNKIVNKNKLIALTFDDGPNHNTIKVLNTLEKYGIKATFFILGSSIKGNEKIIERMNNLEMEIGNHMYSHKISTKLSNKEILEEINKTDKLIYNITGKYPSYIRPSYGIYNNRIKKIIDRPIILWNIDTLDWKYHDSKRISNKVFNNINKGNIILMHDIYNATSNSLEIIIPKLLEEGFTFVTISELLSTKN